MAQVAGCRISEAAVCLYFARFFHVGVIAGLTSHAMPAPSTLSDGCSKLNLPLPHKVKHKEGNAKWDAAKHELQVRVPVIRVDPF